MVLCCDGLYQRWLVQRASQVFDLVGVVVQHPPASAQQGRLARLKRYRDPRALLRQIQARRALPPYERLGRALQDRLFRPEGIEPAFPASVPLLHTAAIKTVEALLAEATARAGAGEELARLARELYPTTADLQATRHARHEIGSHGHHHYPRQCLDAEAFEAELLRSRQVLERVTGQAPQAFSYPFNSYQSGDAELCSRHYVQVATVDAQLISRDTPRLAIPRFTWPGPLRNPRHFRRWLLTGHL